MSNVKDAKSNYVNWNQLLLEIASFINDNSGTIQYSDSQKAKIQTLLERYESNEENFKQYLFFHESGYTKNLVEDFGSTCNVIIMCWAPKQESTFHSHEGSRCFVKILKGELTEQQVPYPLETSQTNQLELKTRKLTVNDVAYIDDSIGLHKVMNESSDVAAVTLHIYMPAYRKCRVFSDEKNLDTSQSLNVTFYSSFGKVSSN